MADEAIVARASGEAGATAPVGTGLNNPWGIAVDAAGNIYVADLLNNVIRLLRPTQ